MAATDVRQLILQVDASVAVAQRNLQALARSVDGSSSQMDASLGKVDRAFSKLGKSAEDSAGAFIAADKNAKRLIASIDPLYAAQLRYNDAMEEAARLNRQGTLDAAEYTKVQAGLRAQLEQSQQQFGRIGGVAGGLRSGLQQLSFQVGDVAQGFALGVRPMTIFAQQSGQVVQAFQLMGASGNRFLSFLAGPWGLAISSAATVLLLLVSKIGDAEEGVDDLVKKMREQAKQAALNEQADRVWANSLEGVTEALLENKKALEELGKQGETAAQQALVQAQASIRRLKLIRDETEALIQQTRAQIELNRARSQTAGNDPRITSSLNTQNSVASARLDSLASALPRIEQQIAEAERQFQEALSFRVTELAGDEVALIKRKYEGQNGLIEQARKRAVAEKTISTELAKQVDLLKKQMEAEIEAAQARNKTTKGLPQVTGSEVAKALGTSINPGGGTRSPAHNKRVGGAANSYHLSGQAIDIPLTVNGQPLTKEGIRSTLEPLGIQIKELLGPGDPKHDDHFHIAFSKTRLGPDQIAKRQEVAANKAERERLREVRLDNGFEEKFAQLDNQLLAVKMELVEDITKQASYAAELVRAEQDRVDLAIQNDVEEQKLSQAQADILKAKNEEIAQQKLKNIEVKKQVDQLRSADEQMQAEKEFAIDQLRFLEERARTQGQHRTLQLQIIDLVYEEKRLHLEYLKAQALLNENTEEAARIQGEINRLPTYQAMDRARAERGTRSPMEAFADSVPQTAEEMAEAMEQLQVQGINGVIDSLVALQGGWKDMRDVAISAIQDIIAQLIRMQLMKLAMNLIGSASGGFDAAGFGATVASNNAALGGISMNTGWNASAPLFGAASGVHATIGGRGGIDSNVLSINGRPTLKVSSGEDLLVLPKSPRVSMPRSASNDNRGGNSYHISVTAPNTGNAKADRRTAMQQAALVRQAVATVNRKGG